MSWLRNATKHALRDAIATQKMATEGLHRMIDRTIKPGTMVVFRKGGVENGRPHQGAVIDTSSGRVKVQNVLTGREYWISVHDIDLRHIKGEES